MTNDHLSDWEIEELVIAAEEDSGSPLGRAHADAQKHAPIAADRARQHLEGCKVCSSHKDQLQALLLLYRDDAVQATDAVLQRRGPNAFALGSRTKASSDVWRWGVWKWSLALILLLAVLLPLLQRHQQVLQQHEAQIAQDNLLLQQVDEEVDSSVPHPLQSLTNLVVARENTNE